MYLKYSGYIVFHMLNVYCIYCTYTGTSTQLCWNAALGDRNTRQYRLVDILKVSFMWHLLYESTIALKFEDFTFHVPYSIFWRFSHSIFHVPYMMYISYSIMFWQSKFHIPCFIFHYFLTEQIDMVDANSWPQPKAIFQVYTQTDT